MPYYPPPSSGGGAPGGSNTQVQFNDSSSFGGDPGLTYDKTTDILTTGRLVTGAGTSASEAINIGGLGIYNNGLLMFSAADFWKPVGVNYNSSPIGLWMNNGAVVAWDSAGAPGVGSRDLSIARNAAGVLEINNGTIGQYRDALVRAMRYNAVTFANAVASPVEGTLQAFTDSSTATWGATITGGGANHVIGYYNGTNWTVAAK